MIELMVVLVVMAILAGAVAPGIVSATRRHGVRAAATRVADLLDFACAAAVARHQPVAVSLDAERRACSAFVRAVSLPWLPQEDSSETQTLTSVELPEGIKVSLSRGSRAGHGGASPPSEMIWFQPDGTAEDVVIELTDARGAACTIEVVSVTAEVLLTDER